MLQSYRGSFAGLPEFVPGQRGQGMQQQQASQLDTAALAPVLKQKYTQRKFALMSYKNNPFYALVQKDTDFNGANKAVGIRNATPQGRGHTIAVATANQTASVYNRFVVTRISDYALATITGEAIYASEGNAASLIDGLTKEIDGAINTSMRALAIDMVRDGGGSRGQISTTSNVLTTTITLQTASDVTNFELGMTLCGSLDDGTGTNGLLNAGATTVTITGIDRNLATITASSNWSTIPGMAANCYLFQSAAGIGSDYGQAIKGIAAWLPTTAPGTTDSFFGVNRSQDVTRLAGVRQTINSEAIEDSLIDMATIIAREGGIPSHVFMNPFDWAKTIKAIGSKVIYNRETAIDMPEIGFQAVMLAGPTGPIKILADLNFPQGVFYMLQLDTWSFDSLGTAPRILDPDGLTIRFNPNADTYTVRIGYYGNLICEAPGYNGVGQFGS
jgi:hypothetical protein